MKTRMQPSKLYLIEGIPGSGKTTTATFVHNLLLEQGVNVKLFMEGNPDHPADYESTACLTVAEYTTLLQNHPTYRELLEKYSFAEGSHHFLNYSKLYNDHQDISKELYDELARKDVYELPLETHLEVTLARLEAFAKQAATEDCTYVFECCFLQNPLTTLVAKHNADPALIVTHVGKIAKFLAPLHPALIYFHSDDVEATLDHVIAERSPEWFAALTSYYTEQTYGKHHGVAGKEGVLHFLKARMRAERELLTHLQLPHTLILQNAGQNREGSLQEIAQFVRHVQAQG